MIDTTDLRIKPESDVTVLLGRKPFPAPFTHLSLDTEIETVSTQDEPFLQFIKSRTLKVVNGESVLAATARFRIDVPNRTIRLWKKHTSLYC